MLVDGPRDCSRTERLLDVDEREADRDLSNCISRILRLTSCALNVWEPRGERERAEFDGRETEDETWYDFDGVVVWVDGGA